MKEVYLKTGQRAKFVKKIDEKSFLVEPVFIGYEGDEEYEYPGQQQVVDAVFDNPPTPALEEQCALLKEEISEKEKQSKELSDVLRMSKLELDKLERTKTDIGRMIFNRSELKTAQRIVVFPKDEINPLELNEKVKKYLKFSIEFRVRNGEERVWAYQCYGDDSYDGPSHYIDPKYGLMCDPSDEEVLRIAKERVVSREWNIWNLKRADEKYLTPELIERKKKNEETERQNKIEKLKSQIEKDKAELEKLQ